MKLFNRNFLFVLSFLSISQVLDACETCSIYSVPELKNLFLSENDRITSDLNKEGEHRFKLNAFTRYSELDQRLNGRNELDSLGEEIDSYVHQVSLEWQATPKIELQMSLPFFNRNFKQLREGRLVSDEESGLGDLAFLAKFRVYDRTGKNRSFRLKLIAAVKAPTGNSDRISEGDHDAEDSHHEEEEAHDEKDEEQHGHGESAISGHDVTLGSGSWDLVGGMEAEWFSESWMSSFGLQYFLRDEGDFGYEFADDLYLSAHVGRTLVKKTKKEGGNVFALALRGGVVGEFRDADRQKGVSIDHTKLKAWYLDLTTSLAWKNVLAEIGVDLPLQQDSGAETLVPRSRLRISLGYYF